MKDTSKYSDEEIVEVVRRGDKEAYAEIVRRYQSKLLRYATYILSDAQMGADVVQEGFIKAYINLNGFDTKRKFSSWIYRIVHNEAMRMFGKNKKLQPLEEWAEVDSKINLEEDFIKKELTSFAHNCLEQMPIIYKIPLSLYYLEEKSYTEISDILRVPVGTVGTRINRARTIMKKICQKHIK